MYCRQCGAYNREDSRYCENCGKPLFAPPPQYPQKDNEPEKKKRRVIWTAIIAAMTVLLAVIAVVVWIRVGQERKYTEQMELGDRYLAEMKYEDAQICFRKAIEFNPKQAQPYIQLSTALVETQQYDEAEEVLTEALEVIPAKETKKVEAIRRKLSEVQELIKIEEEQEEDPLNIAMEVLGYPYLSENSYTMQFAREDGNFLMIGMEEEGILCADRFDYDQDGDEEIFVVVLAGSGTPWWYSRAFLLVMLEQTEGDSWSEAAEITVDVSLNVAVCPARIEFFARTYPDHVGIFLEDTSIAQHLADGVSWKLSQISYQDGSFQQVGEQINMAGSDDVAHACLEMDESYDPAGYPQGRQQILDFTGSIHELEIYPQRLGWDSPLTEQDGSLRKLVRLVKTTDITPQQTGQWQQNGALSPLGPVEVKITDFCREEETAEDGSQTAEYQADIVTYQGNDEIQYPQFSPSSDTVDRWNTHYEEMAATVQQTQNDTLAQGAAQAWAKLEAQIMYQEGSLVSIRFFSDEYYGGAHNMTREFGETIDLAGDHTYTLPELLNTDAATAQQMVNDGFNQLIAQRPDEFFPDTVCDVSADFNEVGYYKTAEGIHVISSLYWLAPFSSGTHEILLQPLP